MTGIVLCGGASTRMGTDKGTYAIESSTWAQKCAGLFEVLNLPYVISLREEQLKEYEPLFTNTNLICDTSIPVFGPLKGLLSVHAQMPEQDLLVLACDMPLMQKSILEQLIQHHQQQPQYDCYLFVTNGIMQPLCAIYTANRLQTLHNQMLEGKLQKHSMMHFVESSKACMVEPDSAQLSCFDNFNTPGDMARLADGVSKANDSMGEPD